MTYIITIQHIQIALFGIKFDVTPEDCHRPPKHIGEETVLLYAYIYIYIYIYIYNQIAGITKRKITTFQALAAV